MQRKPRSEARLEEQLCECRFGNGRLAQCNPLVGFSEHFNQLWQVGVVEYGCLTPFALQHEGAGRANEEGLAPSLVVIGPDCGSDAADFDFMRWFLFHRLSFFGFSPMGLGT